MYLRVEKFSLHEKSSTNTTTTSSSTSSSRTTILPFIRPQSKSTPHSDNNDDVDDDSADAQRLCRSTMRVTKSFLSLDNVHLSQQSTSSSSSSLSIEHEVDLLFRHIFGILKKKNNLNELYMYRSNEIDAIRYDCLRLADAQ